LIDLFIYLFYLYFILSVVTCRAQEDGQVKGKEEVKSRQH